MPKSRTVCSGPKRGNGFKVKHSGQVPATFTQMKNFEEPEYRGTTLVPMVVETDQPRANVPTIFIRGSLRSTSFSSGRPLTTTSPIWPPRKCSSCRRKTRRETFSCTSIRRAARSPQDSRFTTPCSFVKPDVVTTCVGQAASIAAVVARRWRPKKKRFALPNARILIHQPWDVRGWAGRLRILTCMQKRFCAMRTTINQLLAKHSGQARGAHREGRRARFTS